MMREWTPEERAKYWRKLHVRAVDHDGDAYCVDCEISAWPCIYISSVEMEERAIAAEGRAAALTVALSLWRQLDEHRRYCQDCDTCGALERLARRASRTAVKGESGRTERD